MHVNEKSGANPVSLQRNEVSEINHSKQISSESRLQDEGNFDITKKETTIRSSMISETKNISIEIIRGTTAREMDQFLQSLEKNINFKGTVLIQRKGITILSKGYGEAKEGILNTPQTAFQIASTSKQFTAVAILKLMEKGTIKDLNDPINLYLPENLRSEKFNNISVHQLLSHSSGLPNNFDLGDFKIAKVTAEENGGIFKPTKEELIGFIQQSNLPNYFNLKEFRDAKFTAESEGKIFQPTLAEVNSYKVKAYQRLKEEGKNEPPPYYSNNNYYLLGAIIEEQSKKSYGDFIVQDVIPKKMISTGYYGDEGQQKIVTAEGSHLNANGDSLLPSQPTPAQEAYSAGGLYSSAEDLAVWNKALYQGNIISKESLELMFKDYGVSDDGQHFGYGTFIEDSDQKKYLTSGTLPGLVKSQVSISLESGDSIILLANNFDVPEIWIRNTLEQILKGIKPVSIINPDQISGFPENVYFNNPEGNALHQFIREGDKLYVISNGNRDPLIPLSDGTYINVKWGTNWRFENDQVIAQNAFGKTIGSLTRVA